MTDTTESSIEPARESTDVTPAPHDRRPNRVYQAAAWVAIVAGVVFIVGAIFFTGFALGRHSGPGHGFAGPGSFRHHGGMDMPRPPMGARGDGEGPGMMGPGMMGPGGPGMRGPGAAPSTSVPAPPPPPSR